MRRVAGFAFALAFPLVASAATLTVNDTGDAGDAVAGNGVCATSGAVCTLRAAIQEANALAGTDTIQFAIGTGPQTIAPAGDLPAFTQPIIVDATTQPGSGAGPRIFLDGQNARTVGLDGSSVTMTITGLAIGRFTVAGIRTLQGGDVVTIRKCWIGLGLDGVTAMPNGDGVRAIISDFGGSALILGDTSGGGNVISGNSDMAVEITDNGGAGAKLAILTMEGNIVGLGADGMTAVPNASGGVRTNLQFVTQTIGGSVAARNILSGNGGTAFAPQGFLQSDATTFSFNYVGVASDGITPRPNNGNGATLVARTFTVESNVIAANTGSGITVATSNLASAMRGNRIGVGIDGSAHGNGGSGIAVTSGSLMVIGGPVPADQNLIAYNTAAGIRVSGSGEADIDANSIHDNGSLGIDLNVANVADANDANDADTNVGNNGQNRPSINSAVRGGGVTFINGSLSSAASSTYRIRVYMNTAADPSGFGEGETYLGETTLSTSGAGNGAFSFSTPLAPEGSFITATATAANGDTSEFSNALVVGGPQQFRFTGASATTPESGNVMLTVERVNGSAGTATVNYFTDPGSADFSDFANTSGTLSFGPGETSKTISIAITADTKDEGLESFGVVLTGPTGAELGSPANATVHITDDDAPPALTIQDASATEGNSGFTPLSFDVTLSAPSGLAVTIDYATASVTATAGSDYSASTGQLTFAPGETSKTIVIQAVGDTTDEPDETFNVALSNPAFATIADGNAAGTIVDDDAPPPAITIQDASANEGNSGDTPLSFDVTLSAASDQTVTVGYSTANGTATAGTDYTAFAGTLTFAPGETLKTIDIQVHGDTLTESNETFTVTLSNPASATIADGSAVGTIVNDDGLPSITIDDVAVIEGDSGTSTALFTVRLSGPGIVPAAVDWSTADDTAQAGVDYEAVSATTLTFAPGETEKTIAVVIDGDALIESNETFFVNLAGPAGATLADAQGNGTIADDDGTPSLSINDPAIVEGVNAVFTVTLAPASGLPVTVHYAASDLSASAPGDYSATSGDLTFNTGETSKTVIVPTTADSIAELGEQFQMTLSAPVDATIGDATGVATILDDDGVPRVTIGNAALAEGDASSSLMSFTVDLSHASASAIDVQWTTANGSATAGSDYTANAGTLTFAPGETSKTIDISILGDTLVEPDETLFVQLAAATNATITDDEGAGTITNDDGGAAVTIGNVTQAEGTTFSFAVSLSAATSDAVTVQWATADGTASSASDYTAGSGSITFAPGETSKTIDIDVAQDATFEPNETFFLDILGATNATIDDGQGAGTILNDDPPPAVPLVIIGPASVTEGNAGSTSMTFTVQLSTATTIPVIVHYATGGGNATPGVDYVSTSGTLTFAPGVTSQNIVVPVIGDTLVEGNETLTMTLDVTSATGTILDDDPVPAVPLVIIGPASVTEGNAGSTSMTFTVQLSTATTIPVIVHYATGGGNATPGVDYVSTSGTLTFAPGVTSQNIVVPVIGDTLVEGNETLTMTLDVTSATGTILDDDPVPAVPLVIIGPASVTEGNAGSTSMTFTVQLSTATTIPVIVHYATGGGNATPGVDYVSTSGTLTFAPGVTSQNIVVPVIGDTLVEGNETLTMTLDVTSATGTILDDDTLAFVPAVSIGDVTHFEGDSGATIFTFPVTLDAAGTSPVSVAWTTANGSASSADFIGAGGTLVFMPGMTTQSIAIAVNGDDVEEADETFSVQLSAPINATLADAVATGTIRNDDQAPSAMPSLSVADLSVNEGGQAIVTLRLSSRAESGASVRWMTHAGTATSGADFTEASGRVTFGSNTTASLTLDTIGDRVDESDETFELQLFDADGVTLGNDHATITILDDDEPAAQRAIVMAVGSLRGNSGSRFGTAVQLVNFSDAASSGLLVIHPAGASDATRDSSMPYVLAAGELRSYGDLLADFGLEGLATLDVIPASGATPRLTVRIYDDGSGHGTTGFTLPAVTPDDALVAGDRGLLIAPDDPIAQRFNVGLRALDDGASLTIEVRDRIGNTRHTTSREVAPNWFNQIPGNDFAGIALQSGDYLAIHVTRGSAILYGAAVDNLTNDPSVQVVTK